MGPHSHNTVSWATQFAAEFNARLTLAHITPAAEIFGPEGKYVDSEWKEKLVSSAARQLAELQHKSATKAEIFVDSGDVPVLLSEAAMQANAELLVIGRRQAGGHLGASGYGIIRESHIPVLSV